MQHLILKGKNSVQMNSCKSKNSFAVKYVIAIFAKEGNIRQVAYWTLFTNALYFSSSVQRIVSIVLLSFGPFFTNFIGHLFNQYLSNRPVIFVSHVNSHNVSRSFVMCGFA